MKTKTAFLCLLSAAVAAVAAPAPRAAATLVGGTDRSPASYAVGDTVRFTFAARTNGVPADAWVRWHVSRGAGIVSAGRGFSPAASPLVVEAKADEPGFLRAGAFVEGFGADEPAGDGPEAKRLRRAAATAVGAGAGVSSLRPVPEPEGFDDFWRAVKAEAGSLDVSGARRVPLAEAAAPEAVQGAGDGSFAFELPLGDGLSASGFVVMPQKRPASPLPLVVVFSGYDDIEPSPSRRNPLWGLDGAVVAHLTTHGFPFGLGRKRYMAEFEKISACGVGGAFCFVTAENEKPETSRFRLVALRDLAALRFLASIPETAGTKPPVFLGAHLGAWRALVAASLAPSGGAALWNPWPCDFGGAETFGRPAGWLPEWRPALAFFDSVNVARRVEVPVAVVSAPLASRENPPEGAALLAAALAGPRSVHWVQGLHRGERRVPGPAAAAEALESVGALAK